MHSYIPADGDDRPERFVLRDLLGAVRDVEQHGRRVEIAPEYRGGGRLRLGITKKIHESLFNTSAQGAVGLASRSG